MTSRSHFRQLVVRARRVWSELSYAQRRMFEIRTGLPPARPRFRVSTDELERNYEGRAA
jgi:hypothetical protein